jgi:hypothetical protein
VNLCDNICGLCVCSLYPDHAGMHACGCGAEWVHGPNIQPRPDQLRRLPPDTHYEHRRAWVTDDEPEVEPEVGLRMWAVTQAIVSGCRVKGAADAREIADALLAYVTAPNVTIQANPEIRSFGIPHAYQRSTIISGGPPSDGCFICGQPANSWLHITNPEPTLT